MSFSLLSKSSVSTLAASVRDPSKPLALRTLSAGSCCHRHSRTVARKTTVHSQKDDFGDTDQLDSSQKRQLEDELRDPKNFLEYFLPRPLRLALFGGSALSCFVGALITAAKLIQEPALQAAEGTGPQNLIINIIGIVVFASLYFYDQSAAERRVEQRRQIRQAQIRSGDREVFVNEQGETMSRLKEVNDDWILRRLERWGKKEGMPFLGQKKGAILQQLVQQRQPKLAVEVGTMAGYSAILIAQALPPSSKLISIEKDLSWWLVAKRFIWQASQGEKNKQRQMPLGNLVDNWLGDAVDKLPAISSSRGQPIDFLFLDGTPKETLAYLKAAEPYLAEGAVVVADNAGIFAEGGMKSYLEYVRYSTDYSSRYIESTLEWRDDVPDGMEVSVFKPPHGAALPSSSSQQASVATSSL